MTRSRLSLALLTLLLTGSFLGAQPAAPAPAAAPSPAQSLAPRPRVSPHETVGARIDGNRITLVYGRPYAKDPKTGQERVIWGGLVPYGKVWRTGADEATLLLTRQALDFGGIVIPAGAYTLYTLPAADGSALLLVNKQVGQWGADPYDATQELARIPLTKEALNEVVEQFTLGVEKNPAGGGVIRLRWEKTQYSAAFTVRK